MKKLLALAFSGVLATTLLMAPPLMAGPKCKEPATIKVPLSGRANWYIYARKELRAVSDPSWNYTLVTAELIITDRRDSHGKDFVLHTQESFDNGDGTQTLFREVYFKGTMTPEGKLRFAWPKTFLEMNWDTGNLEPTPYPNVIAEAMDHTGYIFSGPGLDRDQETEVFEGTFDGKELYADTVLFAHQVKPGGMGWIYETVVDGPITFTTMFDLKVDE